MMRSRPSSLSSWPKRFSCAVRPKSHSFRIYGVTKRLLTSS